MKITAPVGPEGRAEGRGLRAEGHQYKERGDEFKNSADQQSF